MRNALPILTLLGSLSLGATAYAGPATGSGPLVQPVYWSGDYTGAYCGPRCQEHRRWRHHRWEARRHWWHHRQWEERRYGSYPYSRY